MEGLRYAAMLEAGLEAVAIGNKAVDRTK